MFKGKGTIFLRKNPLINVTYKYELSRDGTIWEGCFSADMRFIHREIFCSPLSLKCLSGVILDLRITSYSDSIASFKGTSRLSKRARLPAVDNVPDLMTAVP